MAGNELRDDCFVNGPLNGSFNSIDCVSVQGKMFAPNLPSLLDLSALSIDSGQPA